MWRIVLGISGALAVGAAVAAGPTDINEIRRQDMAKDFVLATLKDPDSAKFRNQKSFCGEVNAKNSYGGYTGFKRFIAAGKDLVVLEGDKNLARGAFQQAWEEFCR
ncbi:hypothetical protein [Achromobacter xylosoxidans]|uniref:hypothetical protein n=1 Tax=Alcaligenes xylosoxydans xylosoxydans TaxID=85698 RepID=UPI002449DA80|nr:hypothetical protein [Achromobacter xylosoxidans]MDH0520842.1 hypothetical protein [Achromobacter xylosoxidans]MDH0544814.1 hypothetical protein [Achromobacter xylosoxidans]